MSKYIMHTENQGGVGRGSHLNGGRHRSNPIYSPVRLHVEEDKDVIHFLREGVVDFPRHALYNRRRHHRIAHHDVKRPAIRLNKQKRCVFG